MGMQSTPREIQTEFSQVVQDVKYSQPVSVVQMISKLISKRHFFKSSGSKGENGKILPPSREKEKKIK